MIAHLMEENELTRWLNEELTEWKDLDGLEKREDMLRRILEHRCLNLRKQIED